MFKHETMTVDVGGKPMQFETGKIARQANGAVIVKVGETMVFCSACAASGEPTSTDFFPLQVVYQENYSAIGRTSGGFIKRQGRPHRKKRWSHD